MPPFNFGQTFNQSLQSSLSRAQQRQAQKASRQLRLKRLRQQAEQARKDRQMQRTQFAERQENAERRLDLQKEQQEFNREQQVAQSMQQMFQNAQQARFRDRRLDIMRDRMEAQTGQNGITVTNEDFEGMNPLPEGQSAPLQSLGRAGRQAYWRSQMQDGQSFDLPDFEGNGTSGDATGSGGQSAKQQDTTVPSSGISGSEVGQFVRKKLPKTKVGQYYQGAKMLGSMLADPITADFTQEKQQRFQEVGSEASSLLGTALSPDTNPIERDRAMKRGLTKTQKALAELKGFEDNEQAQQLRRQFSTLQQIASRMQSGNPMKKQLRRAGRQLLGQFGKAETIEERTKIVSEVRKLIKQMSSQ